MFIDPPEENEAVAQLYESDREQDGFVMNLTRIWAWRPGVTAAFLDARKQLMAETRLFQRELAVLVCATARAVGDSYCSLAWGANLAHLANESVAAELLSFGGSTSLSEREAALARWADKVVSAPNETNEGDIDRLRSSGLDDQDIVDATMFIAFREAFSTVNDALGAEPDHELWREVPEIVRDSVAYGRLPSSAPPD